MGREIKFGFLSPQTGGTAAFGIPDNWCSDRWQEFAKAGQLVDADGIAHPMSVVIRDTQSDINYGATVAADLITNAKVDILMAASTTDTTIPAALQAEALGCPCVLTDSPADSLLGALGTTKGSPVQVVVFRLLGQPGAAQRQPRPLRRPGHHDQQGGRLSVGRTT